ncbi:MAG TPA: hypothetical protein VJ974_06725 [Geopsychrobacteraceae bacterium]|nr:hypothetical protein [Geopsychrobacteraceae bacterium]
MIIDKTSILILDCKGAAKPAVCFSLEVAGFSTYVVTDENEAINLLSNARTIEKNFSCLIVNDYDPETDPSPILETLGRSGVCETDCRIIFSGNRDVKQDVFSQLAKSCNPLKIYACHSTQTVDLVTALQKGK